MRRPALVMATVTLLSLVSFVPSSSALPGRTEDPARTAVQRLAVKNLKWEPCFERKVKAAYRRVECTTLKSPLDWKKPNGKKITLHISRLKARKKPRGVVFTNPGGPGDLGWTLPLVFIDAGRNRLLDTMDIIGIDVRGTGYSTQASCKRFSSRNLDPRNRSAGNIKAALAQSAKFAKSCQNSGNKKLPSKYVTTAQTVYDLEWIRRNLKTSDNRKVNKIHWIGYSAGTWLGAYYARKWPKHTGRFVLDSVVNFASTWEATWDAQPEAFQKRFGTFARWAARHNGSYGLGTSQKAVTASYERIRADVVKAGTVEYLDYDGNSWDLYPQDVDQEIVTSLYSKYFFEYLAGFLADLSEASNAREARAARRAHNPYAGQTPTFMNIGCNDTPTKRTPEELVTYSGQAGPKYPLMGYARLFDSCVYWKRPSGQLKLPLPVGRGLPKVLMIHSVGDPATWYGGAVQAHKAYRNSRLVTVRNEGDHAIYAGDNPCVNAVVEKYLIDGVYPKKDLSCSGRPMPTPLRETRERDRPVNPVLRAAELAEAGRG
ncbi:alpha/beta hydrolase [Actinocorallia populi]|uniref:alpha/beta hydrolase n=1 Tax=Actinocorallia populi TaxID=2079200 RepID=UPI000D088E79|nr:alpha/beta hydrolase [Actinocorallia populi]